MGGNELPVSLVSCFEIALFHNIIFINFNFLCLQFFFFQTVHFQKVEKISCINKKIIRYSRNTINVYSLLSHEW